MTTSTWHAMTAILRAIDVALAAGLDDDAETGHHHGMSDDYWSLLRAAREHITGLELELRAARVALDQTRAELDIQRRRAALMEGSVRTAWQFAISGPSRPPVTPRNPPVRVDDPPSFRAPGRIPRGPPAAQPTTR